MSNMGNMETIVTVRLPKAIVDKIDEMISKGIFINRSDAMRAAARVLLETTPVAASVDLSFGGNYLACKLKRPNGLDENQAIYCPAQHQIIQFKNCKDCAFV